MTKERALEVLNEVKNGTIGTIVYESDVPVTKEAKESGIEVKSITKKFVRFGASYKNLIKDIQKAEVSKPRANNYEWLIPNKVSYNSNTQKEYMRISNINKKIISREYVVTSGDTVNVFERLDDIKEFLKPLSSSYSKPIVQNVKLDNIVSINGMV